LYIPGHELPIMLDEGAPMTRFLARIRDEVHRFVITFHRAKRSKRVFNSKLDSVSGVTAEMKRRLLKHFKSNKGIAAATSEEVAKVGRMPGALAQRIVLALNKK
jgi:excinuclease ABC subunit C